MDDKLSGLYKLIGHKIRPDYALIAFTWVQIAIFMIRNRSFPQKVAFAPAILLAVAVNMAS